MELYSTVSICGPVPSGIPKVTWALLDKGETHKRRPRGLRWRRLWPLPAILPTTTRLHRDPPTYNGSPHTFPRPRSPWVLLFNPPSTPLLSSSGAQKSDTTGPLHLICDCPSCYRPDILPKNVCWYGNRWVNKQIITVMLPPLWQLPPMRGCCCYRVQLHPFNTIGNINTSVHIEHY